MRSNSSTKGSRQEARRHPSAAALVAVATPVATLAPAAVAAVAAISAAASQRLPATVAVTTIVAISNSPRKPPNAKAVKTANAISYYLTIVQVCSLMNVL